MVANAAVVAPVDFITDDHIDGWQKTFDVNLKGHLLCYKCDVTPPYTLGLLTIFLDSLPSR